MGACMRDHSKEDIFEKLEDLQTQLPEEIWNHIATGLKQERYQQQTLNEIFHALKKLEKKITKEEKDTVFEILQGI